MKQDHEADVMMDADSTTEDRLGLLSDALPETIAIFRRLDAEGRIRLLRTLSTLFDLETSPTVPVGPSTAPYGQPSERFSKDNSLSAKEFLLKKQPQSDVERVACLAYYLAHYRDQPHFKTFDISKVNTEAAQTKFSNPARAVDNATKYGYLVPAVKGTKQMSAAGEMYVEALPDKAAASSAFAHSRPRRSSPKHKRVMVNG